MNEERDKERPFFQSESIGHELVGSVDLMVQSKKFEIEQVGYRNAKKSKRKSNQRKKRKRRRKGEEKKKTYRA
jgi:hypothetical protein